MSDPVEDGFLTKWRNTAGELDAGAAYGRGFIDGQRAAVQAERERIRTGVDELMADGITRRGLSDVLAVIDGKESSDE